MALNILKLSDTFLAWYEKTNSAINIINNQITPDKLNLLSTVSKDTLVNAINEVYNNKLDRDGGVVNNDLQVSGEFDSKKTIRVGSDEPNSSIIKFYDSSNLKYRDLKFNNERGNLTFTDRNDNINNILTSNTTIDLTEENIDLTNKKTTSNIMSTIKGKEAQLYYSQDEKRLYLCDGVKVGGYKISINDDIGDTNLVKVSSTDNNAGYLNDKLTTDIGLRLSNIGDENNRQIKLQSNTFVGEVKMYAGIESSIPNGWLKCDGRILDRIKYKELFSKIGTIYGTGDGLTTFNLPDMSGRVPLGQSDKYNLGVSGGEEEHTLTIPELPNHKHIAPFSEAYGKDPWGLVSKGHYGSNGGADFDNWWAYTSPVGSDQPHNNMQPYLAMFYIIFTGVY